MIFEPHNQLQKWAVVISHALKNLQGPLRRPLGQEKIQLLTMTHIANVKRIYGLVLKWDIPRNSEPVIGILKPTATRYNVGY